MRKPPPFILILILFLPLAAFAEGKVSSSFETGLGLYIIAFDVPQGGVKVNLPDDMGAGDTISGTVIVKPVGRTEEEQRRNANKLNRYLVEIGEERTSIVEGVIKWTIPVILSRKPTYLVLRDENGEEVARAQIPLRITPAVETPTTLSSENYQFPVIGQTEKPICITGPFDGNFDTTTIEFGGQKARLIAESPRKLVVESPREVVGPTEIELKERNLITKRKFNNLRVVKISRGETPSIPPPPSTHKPTKLKTQEEGTAEEKFLVEQTSAPINKQLEKETKSKSGEIEQQIPTPSSAKESMKKAEDSRAERTPSPAESIEKKAEPKMAKNEQGENPLPSPTPLAEKPAKTEMEKKEATKENTETTPQTEHGGKYTIQIGSFKTEEEAKETAENLISKGYPAFETTAHIPGKGTWYRVRIGTFKTINEAKTYGDKLKSLEPSVESVFVTVNN